MVALGDLGARVGQHLRLRRLQLVQLALVGGPPLGCLGDHPLQRCRELSSGNALARGSGKQRSGLVQLALVWAPRLAVSATTLCSKALLRGPKQVRVHAGRLLLHQDAIRFAALQITFGHAYARRCAASDMQEGIWPASQPWGR